MRPTSRWVRTTLGLALGLALAACDSDTGGGLPDRSDLIGLWINIDSGQVRAFEFEALAPADAPAAVAGKPDVYTLWSYPSGTTPTVAQRGQYAILEGRLVTSVLDAPNDTSQVGRTFGNDILAFTRDRLTLQSDSAASGQRTFTLGTTLP